MTTTHYHHPNAMALTGARLGLGWLARLESCGITTASAAPRHAHESIEVLCCLKGAISYEFDHRPSVTLTTGCFLVIPTGADHRITSGLESPSLRMGFFLRPTLAKSGRFDLFTAATFRELCANLLKKRFTPQSIPNEVRGVLARLADIIQVVAPSSAEITEARVLSTFAFHALASSRRTPVPKTETGLMDEAVKWLETHYAEKVTLAQLVAYMGYSRSRFFNLFREHTGLSPLDWLNRHRIRMAQKLLATGDTTIAEAAHQVGFAELPFFFRLFRRHAGCSPAAYRRQSIASSVASR
ncbi:MAG: helix-turn-helix domain-containing protein [Kiritimatiellae bacterium]|nr:helix-turn-helix domain-containing protein [Kiritimatiellia bacterium]